MRRKTPLNEYKREAFALFQRMMMLVRADVTRMLAHAQFNMAPPPPIEDSQLPSFVTTHLDPLTGQNNAFGLPFGTLEQAQRVAALMQEDYPPEEIESWQRTTSRNAECPVRLGQEVQALPWRSGLRPLTKGLRQGRRDACTHFGHGAPNNRVQGSAPSAGSP